MTDQNRLPSAAEALTQAYERLQLGNAADAEVWIALAREIREGSTRPLLDRALDRLTLHDVEGIVCAHGRVAIRRKGDHAGRWYLHTDDGSNCERHDAPREHLRRISEAAIIAAEDGRTSGALPKAAARHYANDVKHAMIAPDAGQTMPREFRLDRRIEDDPAVTVQVGSTSLTFERVTDDELRNRDRFMDYVRGQQEPPSEATVRLAGRWKAGFDAGQTPPGISASDLPALRSLLDEILRRAQGDPAATVQIAPGREASGGLCEHCHFEIFTLPAEEVGVPDAYRHTLTGQAVCHVRAGGAVTFATPATPQVASGR